MKIPPGTKAVFSKRKQRSHKHTYGHVYIVAGSRSYSGAALLTAEAALRAGAGLVTLAYPDVLENPFRRRLPEIIHQPLFTTRGGSIDRSNLQAVCRQARASTITVCGPGLTRQSSTCMFVLEFIKQYPGPLILDADGINIVSAAEPKKIFTSRKNSVTVITPHPGEMSKLVGSKIGETDEERQRIAKTYARAWQIYCILKGAGTVVASPKGSTYRNTTGGPGLATAGTGDVLGGILGGFVAQYPDHIFAALKAGVFIHGLAGERATREHGERSVIASDVIKHISSALRQCASA